VSARTRAVRILVAAAVVSLLGAACGDGGSGEAAGPRTTLTVVAAASLTEAFTKIGRDFDAANDGVTVRFSFGPSDGLAQQIQQSGGVDVFASASPTWMDAVQEDPGVRDRADFARNRLVIITPADDPAGVDSIDDLADDGVKLVLAAEAVPAGDYAREMLARAGISKAALANVVSNEEDVKGVVQKVALGEADAGVVYVTDVTADVRDRLSVVEIPDDVNVVATYPIAVVSGSDHPSLASRFVSYVSGGRGQDTLRSFGFLSPA
jgi:molybdate transport system substrate-binding protein